MALLHTISDLLSWLGWYVLPFIVILSAIVFIHELGHYLVGRWCGVRIDAFSIGFGPELFARVDSHGTRWRIAALPLGGYVKFHGDANAASVDVGPLDLVGRSDADAGRPAGAESRRDRARRPGREFPARLRDLHLRVHGLRAGRAYGAHRPGRGEQPGGRRRLQPGDLVKSVDGDPIGSFEGLQEATLMSTGLPMTFVVERDGERRRADRDAEGQRGRSGRVRQTPHGPSRPRRRRPDPSDVKIERCSAAGLRRSGARRRSCFIVKATTAYIVGVFAGPRVDRPGLRADRRGADGGRDGQDQPVGAVQPRRLVLGVGRLHEPACRFPCSTADIWCFTPSRRPSAGP